MTPRLLLLPLLVSLALALGCGPRKMRVPVPDPAPEPGVTEPFSHTDLDPIFFAVVQPRTARVDYALAHEDYLDALEDYLARVSVADPNHWPVSDQKAFWINVHNAAALHSIATDWERYEAGRRTVRSGLLAPDPGYRVNERWMTLADMRRHMLRRFDDPRMIYALHWGATGSPVLSSRAYHAAELELRLPQAMERYLRSDRGLRLDGNPPEQTLVVTGVFALYREELLGEDSDDLLDAARALHPPLREAPIVRVERRRFDWSLAQ